jgi:hypothetical protein
VLAVFAAAAGLVPPVEAEPDELGVGAGVVDDVELEESAPEVDDPDEASDFVALAPSDGADRESVR